MLNDLGGLKDCFFEGFTNLGAGSRRFKSSRPDQGSPTITRGSCESLFLLVVMIVSQDRRKIPEVRSRTQVA
jgi:hypothetical protein